MFIIHYHSSIVSVLNKVTDSNSSTLWVLGHHVDDILTSMIFGFFEIEPFNAKCQMLLHHYGDFWLQISTKVDNQQHDCKLFIPSDYKWFTDTKLQWRTVRVKVHCFLLIRGCANNSVCMLTGKCSGIQWKATCNQSIHYTGDLKQHSNSHEINASQNYP